jgi:hypothetical protein
MIKWILWSHKVISISFHALIMFLPPTTAYVWFLYSLIIYCSYPQDISFYNICTQKGSMFWIHRLINYYLSCFSVSKTVSLCSVLKRDSSQILSELCDFYTWTDFKCRQRALINILWYLTHSTVLVFNISLYYSDTK